MTKTQYEKSAQNLLWQLGANHSYKWFDLIIFSVEKVIENPFSLNFICKSLYVDVAARFHTTIYCAERNIRTINCLIWNYGNRELLEEIFGSSVTRKIPCNGAFIDALARYIVDNNP